MFKWLVVIFLIPLNLPAQLQRYKFTQPKMGSYFTITFYDTDSLRAEKLAIKCFSLVDSLNEIYSDYLPNSELNRLCATAGKKEWMHVSTTLLDILIHSQQAWKLSKGSFDITVGPVVRIWRKARKENKFPDKHAVAAAMQSVGFKYVLIDSSKNLVQLIKPAMQLDLGGIGQGYIGQKVSEFLKKNHIPISLVDVSGDIITSDAPPGKNGWKVAINVPESADELLDKEVIIHNKCIITSGDVYQYMIHNGKKYSHIVDPKTGFGVTNQRNVTVITEDGTTADWLTKAFTILPLRKVKRLAKKINAEFLIGTLKKGTLIFYKSKGFEKYRSRIKESSFNRENNRLKNQSSC